MSALDDLIAKSRARRSMPSPADRRALREAAQLSQQDVAECLGVSAATVSRYEKGQRFPESDLLDAYIDLLSALAKEVSA